MQDIPEKQLLINYLLGICTPNERENVELWLDKEPKNVLLLQHILKELKEEEDPRINKQHIKEWVMEGIGNFNRGHTALFIKSNSGRKKEPRINKSFLRDSQLWIKAAAIVLVIVTAAALTFYYSRPGSVQTASEISLQQRTLPHGQTATFRFSEGSVIKLNGGSTLRYPERFEKDRREVYLEGEAFFTVARDEERPFIVHAGNTTTRVLGTSFNIKAYENEEELQVAVAEGKVAVSQNVSNTKPPDESKRVVLEKNQWVTYRNSGQLLEKGEGDIWEMIAWKDEVLIFNNKHFDEVARMLERWYGVDISFESEELKDIVLQGKHKDATLEGVLNSIQYITGMEYEFDGEVVRIY